ncbi:Protein zwilch-like [Stylophora pistillata]|uniref:Protein zwilch n=1 Tax=Stylophora pistillata TaxID=50429 RepID=A0A2B4REH7_STYPI|nr:Protein zwilch-like [Stylophora pistillata]
MVLPVLDYYDTVWNECGQGNSDKIEQLQRRANPQGIIYLGMIPEHETVGGKTVRHVICNGKNEPITARKDLPELSSFLHHHLSSTLSTTFVETHGYALYDVMGVSNFSAQDRENSRITVELTWSGVSSLLQTHPHSCDGVLHIRNIPGSVHLATRSLYLELVRVEAFFKISGEEEYSWPQPAVTSEKTLVSQMDGFFAKLNSSNIFPSVVDEEETKEDADDCTFAEASMAHLTFQEFARKDLDFTERLWLLLKDCVDEDDLVGSLQMCCVALFNSKCQPVVHSSNTTSLAVFIRDLLQFETKEQLEKLQTRAKKFLSSDSAIRCLVEIGCEKLARDYTQYFIQQELATMGQLANYLDNKAPLGTRVSHLTKLHQILELVVTAKSVTRLGHENPRSLTQSALMYYQTRTDSDSQHPTFSLSLPAFGSTSGAAVKSIWASSNPAVWCVSFKSKTKTGNHTTMVQLSTSHPGSGISVSPVYDVSEVNDEDFDSDKEKFQYFLTCAKQVTMPVV